MKVDLRYQLAAFVLMWIAVGLEELFHKPEKAPAAATLSGCFAAAGAPALWFNSGVVQIQEHGVRPRHYSLVLRKWGPLVVAISPGLSIKRTASNGYSFSDASRPTSESRLTMQRDGATYGVVEAQHAQALQVDTDDESLSFNRVDPSKCGQA